MTDDVVWDLLDRTRPPVLDRCPARVSEGPGMFGGMGSDDRRRQATGGDGGTWGASSHGAVPSLHDLTDAAVLTLRRSSGRPADRAAPATGPGLDRLHDLAQRRMAHDVAMVWTRGWQPFEIVRHARRTGSAAGVRLLLAAVAADHAARPPSSIDGRWASQVQALGVAADPVDPSWVRRWSEREGLAPPDEVAALLALAAMLAQAPRLDQLLPPPGAGPDWTVHGVKGGGARFGRGASPGAGVEHDPVLEKVRALLAKAESTSFVAEAEAFTAKAQQLIARHAIDVAVLAVGDTADAPSAVRLAVDDPYADPKSFLLQVVAQSGRCRAAFHPSIAMSTVVGFPSDIAGVEMMFTSLLVQAQAALAAAARTAPAGSRPRSRVFRSSFLEAYASRIGQRLQAINDATVAESTAERGPSILPALLAREAEVDDALDDLLGTLTTKVSRRTYDAAGWASGAVAADNAQLGGVVEGGPRR
jgi:hypothetical protein